MYRLVSQLPFQGEQQSSKAFHSRASKVDRGWILIKCCCQAQDHEANLGQLLDTIHTGVNSLTSSDG